MPELPEVETVRRMLEANVLGRAIETLGLSRKRLRQRAPDPKLARRVRGRQIERASRHGKFLLLGLDGGLTLISHLGMSGRWLFYPRGDAPALDHVHVRIAFADGSLLLYQDPRRFGMFRGVATEALGRDPSLRRLGPDPLLTPLDGDALRAKARGVRASVKTFLLDQRRIAGIGNIYASEILHRARVHPARRSGALEGEEWARIAAETGAVLRESVDRMGTTFSMYRTLWNEPGGYGDRLLVYDRAGAPCRTCGTPIRRAVQGQRATFFCPKCQPGRFRSPAQALRPKLRRGRGIEE